MKEIVEKIGSYNLFNYLMPGVLFVAFIERFTKYSIVLNENLLFIGFIAYSLGLIISRIGSLIVEKTLVKIKFLKYKPYKDFVEASKNDSKLDVLSEQNNTYRTIIALLLTVVFTKFYEWLSNKVSFFEEFKLEIICTLLLAIFLFAYRKQTKYISDRIERNLKE